MTNPVREGFGGALNAALDEVLRSPTPNISVADAGTVAAFISAWSRTLSEHARHLRTTSQALTAPVVVAYTSNMNAFSKLHGWEKHLMLGAVANNKFAGMLIAATGEIAGCVHPT